MKISKIMVRDPIRLLETEGAGQMGFHINNKKVGDIK